MKRIIRISAILLAAILLTGCPTQITAPRDFRPALKPLPYVMNPQIAIGGDGIKHFVWHEYSMGEDRMYYSFTRMGERHEPYLFTPQAPWDAYGNPDVAVRDNGDIFLVWVAADTDPGGYSIFCWQKIPAGGVPTNTCNPLYSPGTAIPYSRPEVVTNGDEVYVVYQIQGMEDLTSQLKYYQLEPLGASGGYVLHDGGDWGVGDYHAEAVEPDGTLHVAWAAWRKVDNKRLFAHYSNRGVTGDMVQHYKTEGFDAIYSTPAIAIDPDNDGSPSDDYVYVAFVKHTIGVNGELVYLRFCNQGGCTTGNQIVANMNPAWEWNIEEISIAANSDKAFLIFVGNIGTAVDDDIFIMDYTGGSATPPTPTQLTTDDIDQKSPRVVIASTAPVFAWVTEPMDVYVYHFCHWLFSLQPQLIHQHRSPYFTDNLDLAGRGDDVAGIGIDRYNDTDKAPYVSFNAVIQYIPMIQR